MTTCNCHPAYHDLGVHAPGHRPGLARAAAVELRRGLRRLVDLVLARSHGQPAGKSEGLDDAGPVPCCGSPRRQNPALTDEEMADVLARELFRCLYPGSINMNDSERTRETDTFELDRAYRDWDSGRASGMQKRQCYEVALRLTTALADRGGSAGHV